MNNITLLSSNPPNRDITIDIAKGIAILLVVLGHLQNPINKYIYAFHMPLFFFLSGMFVKEMSLKDTICQNGYRLLLPFIFYYLYSLGLISVDTAKSLLLLLVSARMVRPFSVLAILR